MKTISLFLISLVVSANLYANEANKSQNQHNNHNNHMGNHIHDEKMTNHMNINGMTDEEMKNMDKNTSCKISDNVSTCFTFMFPFFQTSFKSVKL